jgi:hypothetical protein
MINPIPPDNLVGAPFIAPSSRGMVRNLVSKQNKQIVIPSEARKLLFSSALARTVSCKLSAVGSSPLTFNFQLSTSTHAH